MATDAVERKKAVNAELKYVTKPSDSQIFRLKEFVKKKLGAEEVSLELIEDKAIGGGFVLAAGSLIYDWSTAGRTGQFEKLIETVLAETQYDEKDLLDILKAEVNDFELHAESNEVGTVEFVGDGIAFLRGVDHAVYGEVVVFDDGTRGMVQNIETDQVGCILFGRDQNIREGMRAVRTGKRAGIPVGCFPRQGHKCPWRSHRRQGKDKSREPQTHRVSGSGHSGQKTGGSADGNGDTCHRFHVPHRQGTERADHR